jgi:hypothetical protein
VGALKPRLATDSSLVDGFTRDSSEPQHWQLRQFCGPRSRFYHMPADTTGVSGDYPIVTGSYVTVEEQVGFDACLNKQDFENSEYVATKAVDTSCSVTSTGFEDELIFQLCDTLRLPLFKRNKKHIADGRPFGNAEPFSRI